MYNGPQEKVEMTLQEYLEYWNEESASHASDQNCESASHASDQNCESGSRASDQNCLYLKDWHFQRDCKSYSGDNSIK